MAKNRKLMSLKLYRLSANGKNTVAVSLFEEVLSFEEISRLRD
jgi:hypothetical protein